MFCPGCGKSMEDIKAAYAVPAQPAASPVAMGATCPSCGAPVAEGDAFCMNCGSKIEAPAVVETPAEPEQPAETEPEAPAAVETVPEPVEPAAEEIVDDAPAFVREPEQPAEPVAEEPAAEPAASAVPVCPSCGAPYSAGDAFCMNCGTKLA